MHHENRGNRETRLTCITTYSQLTIIESILSNTRNSHGSEKQARTVLACHKVIHAGGFMKNSMSQFYTPFWNKEII